MNEPQLQAQDATTQAVLSSFLCITNMDIGNNELEILEANLKG